MNDSEQLFVLQKAFLPPRQIGGQCLTVNITMKGRVMDNIYNPSLCPNSEQNLCIYNISKHFELLPAVAVTFTLANILRSSDITQVLLTMDPSFYFLINARDSSE